MATFIMIPGAWHGAWCFELVAPLLEMRGHRAVTPDLPGLGADKTPLAGLTFDHWVDFIAGLVKAQDEPVILLGHSRGGMVISQVAERVPDNIALLVYLTAVLTPNGKNVLEASQAQEKAAALLSLQDETPDGLGARLKLEYVAPICYNLTSPELAARAASLLTYEPVFSKKEVLHLSEERYGRVPRAYIECLQDNALVIETQRKMQEVLPCQTVITMDTDHSPFYSAPEALAEHLDRLAQQAALVE